MATADLHPEDIALLERLGAIAAIVDPVPEDVIALGKETFSFRLTDAELMRFVSDESAVAGVRGGARSHMFFFELPSLTVDVEVTIRDDFAAVLGVVVGADDETRTSTVTLATPAASFTTTTDAEGRFEVANVPPGLMRLTLERGTVAPAVTPWFEGA